MRDDFSKKVKDTLAKQVGYKCSNQECCKSTLQPIEEDNVSNVGVASHIAAASRGGPRYDANQSPEERSSISNGIHLCIRCAKLIDDHPDIFPIEKLRLWKKCAITNNNENCQVPNNLSINNKSEVLKNLKMFLGYIPESISMYGFGKRTSCFIPSNVISNINNVLSECKANIDSNGNFIHSFDPTVSFHAQDRHIATVQLRIIEQVCFLYKLISMNSKCFKKNSTSGEIEVLPCEESFRDDMESSHKKYIKLRKELTEKYTSIAT